jgi:hypothetical protein
MKLCTPSRTVAAARHGAVDVGFLKLGQVQAEQRIVERGAAVLEDIDQRFAVDVEIRIAHRARVDAVILEDAARIAAMRADDVGQAQQVGRAHLARRRHRVQRALQRVKVITHPYLLTACAARP